MAARHQLSDVHVLFNRFGVLWIFQIVHTHEHIVLRRIQRAGCLLLMMFTNKEQFFVRGYGNLCHEFHIVWQREEVHAGRHFGEVSDRELVAYLNYLNAGLPTG